jgi:peptidoglycan hydrolase-like protein with peptidoglycan-binding domain
MTIRGAGGAGAPRFEKGPAPAASLSGYFDGIANELAAKTGGGAAIGPGANGASVQRIQRALLFLGYEAGVPNGCYGKETSAAVKSFQHDAKLGETGCVDAATLAAIDKKAATTISTRKAAPTREWGPGQVRPGTAGAPSLDDLLGEEPDPDAE